MNNKLIISSLELSAKISDAISDYVNETIGFDSHDNTIDTVIDVLNYHAAQTERLKKFQDKIDEASTQ